MTRTSVYSALILKTKASGESNRELWMLTAEEGILRATMFGGPKSRLRSHVSPFHSGRVWIYHDPVRDTRKLSDFDVLSWRPGLRELYERTMTADAIAETILASYGSGGNWETALSLTEQTFDSLEIAGEELCRRIFIFFLWQWGSLLGIQPDMENCTLCGEKIDINQILRYSLTHNAFCCSSCVHSESAHFIEVNPGCRRWLTAIQALSPAQLSRYTMDEKSMREAKNVTQAILSGAIQKRPLSWDW